jgi:hypothetical protein
MICLHCTRLDLRSFPKHSAVGYGRCKAETLPGVFESISIERQCGKFDQADAETIAKREEWNAKR